MDNQDDYLSTPYSTSSSDEQSELDKIENFAFLEFNYKDFPIIIGAIVGSVGLILIVLSAIITWYCCTYTLKRNRDSYYLDDTIEKESKSSNGPGLLNNSESVIFMGIESVPKDLSFSLSSAIKRSQSAPLDIHPLDIDFIRNELASPRDLTKLGRLCQASYLSSDVYNNLNDLTKKDSPEVMPYTSRSQLYEKEDNNLEKSATNSIKTTRITSILDSDEPSLVNNDIISFSKKRKNRMRNDSAAAIALNKSGTSPFQLPFLHKDTDSLVDNEAFVVYDERTVL